MRRTACGVRTGRAMSVYGALNRGLETKTNSNQWIGIMGEMRLILRIALKITE